MQFLVRLIATDLDGTLLRSDLSVSARTQAALQAARDAGIRIVLVSARGPLGVGRVADEIGGDGLAICSNGALILDLASRKVIRHRMLAADVAAFMVRGLRARLPNVSFATEIEGTFGLEPAFKGAWGDWEPPEGSRYADALSLVTAPVTKLMARDATRSVDELADAAREVAGDAAAVAISGKWVVEISAAGVNKAAALRELAAEYGIEPSDVVAFGDYPNDLPMLEWAGHSIATANAHPDVLAQVDEVTASNDEDGVALAIERLIHEPSETIHTEAAVTDSTPRDFSRVYRSAHARSRITTILLGVIAFIAIFSVIQDGQGFGVIEDAKMGILLPDEAVAYDTGMAHLYSASLALTLMAAIAFLAWLSRTVDNTPVLRGGVPSVTPRWSIGWWFVPFVNLVKPYQIVREVHDRMAIGSNSAGDWILLAWWLTWLIGRAVTVIAQLISKPINSGAPDIDAMVRLFSIRGIADSLTFVGAILAIAVVLRIQWRVEMRA
jgi:Cof subfamily protein (haloacid dehalogenase superfamily)